MKRKILLLAFLFAGLQFKTEATHLTGSELTYKALAPNTYEVELKIYRECGSAAFPNTETVQVNAPGCHTGLTVTLNLQSQQERTLSGTAVPSGCAGYYPSNFTVGTYSGTLTFGGNIQSCTDWVLSWGVCCRTDLGNLVDGSTFGLYTEAHLKLLPNLVNSSPQFDTINYQASIAGVGQPILISALAQDADGDSLVYSSVTPMSGVNQPMVYKPIGAGGGLITNPNPQPPYTVGPPNVQYATFPAGVSNYSPTFPIASFSVNWNAINPATGIPFPVVQANPYFKLNPHTGNIAFAPAAYFSGGTGAQNTAQNRYVITVQVDEYRKLNGVATKIGSVRRETYIQVMDGARNANPVLEQVQMNNVLLEEGDLIHIRPGVPMNLTFSATDLDATDVILMSSNVSSILPGAVFAQNNANQPSGSITWTPAASDVREQPYYFNVVLKDNADTLRGYHERTIGVRVSNTGGVTATRDERKFNAGFTAFPNPFTEQVNFKFNAPGKAESILIYNLLGQQLDAIAIPQNASGEQNMQWNNASKHAAGIYIAKLVAKDKTIQTLKFTKVQ